MIQRVSKAAILFLWVLVSSCARPAGGVREASSSVVPLGSSGSRFLVTVEGRKGELRSRTEEAALVRAAEVTLAHRFRYFAVEGEKDMTTAAMVSPGTRIAAGNINGFGGSAGLPVSSNPSGVVVYPGHALTIRCYSSMPQAESGAVHDAAALVKR